MNVYGGVCGAIMPRLDRLAAEGLRLNNFNVEFSCTVSPFTAELTRKLWLESPITLVVEVTRAGALGGPASTTRSTYRKN